MVLIQYTCCWAAATTNAPDFKEVYDLIRAHAGGLSQAQLDRAAVQALVSALAPRVRLMSNESNVPPEGPLLAKSGLFEGDIAYLRIGQVGNELPQAFQKGYSNLAATNKVKGIVIDLRYATGEDYGAAAGVADLFLSKQKPLLNWGSGLIKSKEKDNALNLPVAVLVNRQTAGAAEALAAVIREAGVGLIIGSRTAGRAMIAQEFPLQNGERLRIASAPIQLGDGATLSAEGVTPDISVIVNADDERAYYADPFKMLHQTNANLLAAANLSLTNQASATNRARRTRLNEAELVRERREGSPFDSDFPSSREREQEKPVVRDPALARGLDLLKGLALVRQSRS